MKLGLRTEIVAREVQSITIREIVIQEVTSAQNRACYGCCQTFRSLPLEVDPRCWYDHLVRDTLGILSGHV